MKYNYCTLFNFNYLSRGLVLYDSLVKTHTDFTLYIFAFDEETKTYLNQLNLTNCVIIGMQEFEDVELLRIKPTRSFTEYCWTCTSSVIRYAITKYNLSACTYLDADLYFYTSPEKIFSELSTVSVGITPHNYSKEYDREKVSGKYCVQFVFFRNDENGMKALEWWREKCIEWCYSRIEKDRFGDQKYLDYFSQYFKGVHDINTSGSGIAPWNIMKFRFSDENGIIKVIDTTGKESPVIFYHFHKLAIDYNKKLVDLKKYYYGNDVLRILYEPYLKRLLDYENKIRNTDLSLNEFWINSPFKLKIQVFRLIRKVSNNLLFRKLLNFFQK